MFGSPHVWHILARARAEGRTWYYGDHAYFGRFRFYRITRDAYQHGGCGQSDGKRLKALGLRLAPWKTGREILVCPPDDMFGALHGFDSRKWLAKTLRALAAATDRPVRVRHRAGAESNPVTLAKNLASAHALVTHSSNAAVEALCMGVPVFVTAPCAARAMAESDLSRIEAPYYPDDRKRWAGVLADNQWTLDEIRRGMAARKLDEA